MYSNIRLFSQDYLGLFWPFSYDVLFCIHIEPFWTNNKKIDQFLGNKDNSNIFAIIDITQMNIQIYSSA